MFQVVSRLAPDRALFDALRGSVGGDLAVVEVDALRLEAYDRLRRARRDPNESFSDVVMRAEWPDIGLTGGELLALYERRGPYFASETVDRIEEAKAEDRPAPDKWTEP